MAQPEGNLNSVDFTLSGEEMARLDDVSADRQLYLYWMISRNNATRIPTAKPVALGGIPGGNPTAKK